VADRRRRALTETPAEEDLPNMVVWRLDRLGRSLRHLIDISS